MGGTKGGNGGLNFADALQRAKADSQRTATNAEKRPIGDPPSESAKKQKLAEEDAANLAAAKQFHKKWAEQDAKSKGKGKTDSGKGKNTGPQNVQNPTSKSSVKAMVKFVYRENQIGANCGGHAGRAVAFHMLQPADQAGFRTSIPTPIPYRQQSKFAGKGGQQYSGGQLFQIMKSA